MAKGTDLNNEIAEHTGEWVVVSGGQIVGHDRNLKKLDSVIKASRRPELIRIPEHDFAF